MRFGMIGDNPIEKALIASGLLPPLSRGTGLQAADKPRADAPPS